MFTLKDIRREPGKKQNKATIYRIGMTTKKQTIHVKESSIRNIIHI